MNIDNILISSAPGVDLNSIARKVASSIDVAFILNKEDLVEEEVASLFGKSHLDIEEQARISRTTSSKIKAFYQLSKNKESYEDLQPQERSLILSWWNRERLIQDPYYWADKIKESMEEKEEGVYILYGLSSISEFRELATMSSLTVRIRTILIENMDFRIVKSEVFPWNEIELDQFNGFDIIVHKDGFTAQEVADKIVSNFLIGKKKWPRTLKRK